MSPLDEQIEAIVSILRANGAEVGIEPGAPDYVKKAFFELLLSCPECRQTTLGKHDGHAN
jgi:hypothetical protein